MNESTLATEVPNEASSVDLSSIVVSLLKGVLYKDRDGRQWNGLVKLQAKVRDYVAVLGLDLTLDEAEGYAFLRSKPELDDEDSRIPRLIARRQLSYPVSLLLALIRKRLAEFDAKGGDTRLILTREEIVELVRVFLPLGSNEAQMYNQIDTHLSRIVGFGFLRQLKTTSGSTDSYEVCRILKAFVDAQWLSDFDARLEQYLSKAQQLTGQEQYE